MQFYPTFNTLSLGTILCQFSNIVLANPFVPEASCSCLHANSLICIKINLIPFNFKIFKFPRTHFPTLYSTFTFSITRTQLSCLTNSSISCIILSESKEMGSLTFNWDNSPSYQWPMVLLCTTGVLSTVTYLSWSHLSICLCTW